MQRPTAAAQNWSPQKHIPFPIQMAVLDRDQNHGPSRDRAGIALIPAVTGTNVIPASRKGDICQTTVLFCFLCFMGPVNLAEITSSDEEDFYCFDKI